MTVPNSDIKAAPMTAYIFSAVSVALATTVLWLVRHVFDKGQASLLFLPVVIAVAVRFGFGPAVSAAVLSFLSWDYFFLPPYFTFIVRDARDWLSLIVFLAAAVTTAKLASDARLQAQEARAREDEISTLSLASEAVSQEIDPASLLPTLAGQLERLCQSPLCIVFTKDEESGALVSSQASTAVSEIDLAAIEDIAEESLRRHQEFGFGGSSDLWDKAISASGLIPEAVTSRVRGAYVPLHAQGKRMGVLYVGSRRDGRAFTELDERLIRTLANHAAVVLARQQLLTRAAQVDALREADALKERILSLASHEMRTPLAVIKASTTGLLHSWDSYGEQERRDALQAITQEADRLAALVGNMLDLSRLEAGAWRPEREHCDLVEIVGTALDRLPESDAARIDVAVGADLPLVNVDYTQIVLVVANLLSNALKYGGPGRVAVSLTAVAGSEVQVDVRDYGEGLARGEEERVFERFYRSARHQKSPIHGTGLGLPLCRAIISAHGGVIGAFNATDGPGAIFRFTLPAE